MRDGRRIVARRISMWVKKDMECGRVAFFTDRPPPAKPNRGRLAGWAREITGYLARSRYAREERGLLDRLFEYHVNPGSKASNRFLIL
jgi:hypothetical protein